MSESRCSCGQSSGSSGFSGSKDTVCIDTYRVLDSCRDRDCYEDVRVYLSEAGQEIINRTSNVRVKYVNVICAYVGVDPVQFNRGFYQVTIKFYIKVVCEGCICNGRSQDFEGMAVIEKKVVLYGGEGNVNIYKSIPGNNYCAECNLDNFTTNIPIGVVETVTPIALSVKVVEPNTCCGYSCCGCSEIPNSVTCFMSAPLIDPTTENKLYVSFGMFSVIRIERPAQYLISATDYCVPDKECISSDGDDPCSIFRKMAFPTAEFCAQAIKDETGNKGR